MFNVQSKVDSLALKAFYHASSQKGISLPIVGLITTKEQIKLGRRILIAQAILAGKTRYEVNNHLSVSPNTFAQINRWLESELESYTSAHNSQPTTANKLSKRFAEPPSISHLRRTYPGHFLLVSLVEELFATAKK